MSDTTWEDIRGREVRFRDGTWELTGEVEVQREGAILGADATRTDDNRHPRARLFFRAETPPDSINPGNLGTHFDHIEQAGSRVELVVKGPGRSYQYALVRLEYQ